ncbi:hypothetical protein J8L98_17370 [Pseudoalteromonas sp. MMG013]|uniref:YciI family protein n=1 Tax=unclassified Pseudoalteromonas TaxID=194690 RepID=UPI001B35986B|nr:MULTISPECIES: YciI family protein [unclassified Pseudoalteromonas]MBQ4845262.1 hypothetical protein [Pseudoalteromonas sp. MMG005]MBQ4863456.1 hypothetical protein [Pseudoalteromonas sp. MMG013]
MNEFMLIYKGGDPDWMANTTEQDMAKSMEKWGQWMAQLEATQQLVSGGSPLDYSGKRLSNDKVETDIAAAEFKELVSGYSIIRANNINDATTLAKSCPIFDYPGVEVEIRQIMCTDNS